MYSGQSIPLNYDISSPFSLKNGIDPTTHICNIPESHRTSTNICQITSTDICQIGNQAAKVPCDGPKGTVIF